MTATSTPVTAPGRFASWTAIVAIGFAVLILVALSFALGRATMGHGHTRIVRSTVVQPAAPPVGHSTFVCHRVGPC